MDTLACGFQALKYPACTKLLGPVVPGASMPGGARVPGTSYELDPVQARFRHRRDGPLARLQRHLARGRVGSPVRQSRRHSRGCGLPLAPGAHARQASLTVRDVLTAMIKAHEIQGVLALENSFNRVGLDHVMLVRVASTAVVTLFWAEPRSRSSMPFPMPGSTAAACAPIGTRQTPARARAGRRGTRPAAPCASR